MPEIILGILFYLTASTIHILKYRRRKIGQAGILKAFGVFLLFLPAVYLVSIFLPVRWPLSTVLFYLLLSGTHFIFFTSPYLGDEGPSSKIYFLLKNKGQLDFNKLLKYFSDEELVVKRIRDLTGSGMIKKTAGSFRVTGKGKFLCGLIKTYRRLLNWELGG